MAIATRDEILFVAKNGTPSLAIEYHYDSRQYSRVQVAIMPSGNRYFVWYSPSSSIPNSRHEELPDHIVELSSEGNELNRYELPFVHSSSAEALWHGFLAAFVPSVLVAGAVMTTISVSLLGDPSSEWAFAAMREQVLSEPHAMLILICVTLLGSAIVCAVIVAVIARRYAFGRRQLRWWVAGGFLGGPAVLLALIALHEWPARETCPACGKKRVVNRAECEHCGKEFALPVHDGTEIFDG
jgi:hypothetical protein